MRPSVKNGIALLSPQGFLDGTNTLSLITMDDLAYIKSLKVDMLLVSLKSVIFFNGNGLGIFIKVLDSVREENKIIVGFCDYDKKKYDAILKFYGHNLTFSLFRTLKIAQLFTPSNKDAGHEILLYSDDQSQRANMAIELFNRGHKPIVSQSKKEFAQKKSTPDHYYAIIEDSSLGQFNQSIASRVSGNAVIYTLMDFLDAELSTQFDIIYHTNSLNVGFRLFIFDAFNVISMNVHGLNFFTRLASSGAEYNATLCIVGMDFTKIPVKFKEDLEDSGIMFFDTMEQILNDKELLNELGGSTSTAIKKRLLTKVIVNQLPRFIDATVSTMEMMTNSQAKKTSVNMNMLKVEETTDKIASSIGFYGDIDGMVILIFPKKIAKKACELIIGEETDDMEYILDALAELGNIVAGKVKSLLKDNRIDVNITLPRTYENIDDLMGVVGSLKGVQVNLSFQEDEFVFFLTR
ncbi:MAG: chemotaxis protein CheX [Campylobacterota bacterium]|nr:chemotaxis protein CheX [Campylobacterota bacterium]